MDINYYSQQYLSQLISACGRATSDGALRCAMGRAAIANSLSYLPPSFVYFPISIRPLLPGKNPRSHRQNSSAAPNRLRLASKQARKELELVTPHMAKTFSSQDPHIFSANPIHTRRLRLRNTPPPVMMYVQQIREKQS